MTGLGRFLLFGGVEYYAKGGFYDCLRSFDSLGDATSFAKSEEVKAIESLDWWHVFDSEKN